MCLPGGFYGLEKKTDGAASLGLEIVSVLKRLSDQHRVAEHSKRPHEECPRPRGDRQIRILPLGYRRAGSAQPPVRTVSLWARIASQFCSIATSTMSCTRFSRADFPCDRREFPGSAARPAGRPAPWRATAQAFSSTSDKQRRQIASTMAFFEGKKRYTLAGDMPSSAAMSATAVLAYPTRRNRISAVSRIRARVSSGFALTCGLTGWLAGNFRDY